MININGSTDPSYRYKMPRVVGKVEGRGNGIKTVVVNCREVAASLRRPTEQLLKFVGLEMGAGSRIVQDKCIVNGAIETHKLQRLVSLYVEKFVLCPKCGNPETTQKLNGAGLVVLQCAACGKATAAGNSHRLVSLVRKEIMREVSGAQEGGTQEVVGEQDEPTAPTGGFEAVVELLSATLELPVLKGPTEDAADMVRIAKGLLEDYELPKRWLVRLVWSACVVDGYHLGPASLVCEFQNVLWAVVHDKRGNAAKLLVSAAGYTGPDDQIIKTIPLAIKALYDCDVVSAQDIVGWFEGQTTMDARTKEVMEPLIEWMKNDSDSE